MKLILTCFCLLGFSMAAFAETEQEAAMQKLDAVLKNSRCVPKFENGKPAGYKCFQDGKEIDNADSANGIALKNNDVISDVDGQPVTSPANTFEALDSKRAHKITVKVEGQSVPAGDVESEPPPSE